jgi:hypothetical protein
VLLLFHEPPRKTKQAFPLKAKIVAIIAKSGFLKKFSSASPKYFSGVKETKG